MILDKIDELLKEVQTLSARNAEEVEQLRLKYLSKKGEITALMNDFRNVAADQKKTVGMKINELKTLATERINQLREECATQETGNDAIDLTRTPYPVQLGTRHPLTIVTNEIIDIFSRMGFVLADGPEVEDDLHVFTKMNFAADHPARDMQVGLETVFVSRYEKEGTIRYQDITPEVIKEYNVIVNCTPIGMYPKTEECPLLPYEAMDSHTILYDLIYNPDETLFMKRGAQYGAQTKNGLEMLLLQAFASWEFWHEK